MHHSNVHASRPLLSTRGAHLLKLLDLRLVEHGEDVGGGPLGPLLGGTLAGSLAALWNELKKRVLNEPFRPRAVPALVTIFFRCLSKRGGFEQADCSTVVNCSLRNPTLLRLP